MSFSLWRQSEWKKDLRIDVKPFNIWTNECLSIAIAIYAHGRNLRQDSRLTSNSRKVLMIFLVYGHYASSPSMFAALRICDALSDRALSMESHLRRQSHWTIALRCINVQCVSCRHAWQFIKLILIKSWGFTVTRQWRLIYETVRHGKWKMFFFSVSSRLVAIVEAIGRKITHIS